MTVCWLGFYNTEYSRNQILLSGLRAHNIIIKECNIKTVGWKRYLHLVKELCKLKNQYDIVYCAFPAGYVVPFAWLFQKKPIVVDAFFPMYDAYVHDRQQISPWSPYAWWLLLIDYLTAAMASLVVVDTKQHQEYWKKLLPKKSYSIIPVGVSTDIYYPIPDNKCDERHKVDKFVVTFHGSFIPLQGVDKIVKTAKLLQDEDILFRFIGPDKLHKTVLNLWPEGKTKIDLLPWLSQPSLNKVLNQSDIILGIFGDTEKADRVIPNKVFQGLAVKKAVITKDTRAIRTLFSESELCLVEADVEAISNAIMFLKKNKKIRNQLAKSGYKKIQIIGTPFILGGQLLREMYKVSR